MVANSTPKPHQSLVPDILDSGRRLFSAAGVRRVYALAALSVSDAVRNRVLLGMTAMTCVIAAVTLFWPADRDAERVILVQRLCYGALTLFGLIAAAFLGGASLPRDITTKRIYSIGTKPVGRAEILLGKIIGLLVVMFMFLVIGGLITFTVTHIASADKSYAGGSYTLEVTAPSAVLTPKNKDLAPVPLRTGQILEANARTEDGYEVTMAGRDAGFSGTVPVDAVQLRERSLEVVSVVDPSEVTARGRGKAVVELGELVVWAYRLAEEDLWSFTIKDELPGTGDTVSCRLRFHAQLYEPRREKGSHVEDPVVTFRFLVPDGEDIEQEVHFTLIDKETRPVATQGEPLDLYEEVIALPRRCVVGGKLRFRVVKTLPEHPVGGQVTFGHTRTLTWHLRGFSSSDLPDGRQTLQARFLVLNNTKRRDYVDSAEVTVNLRNPATGETAKVKTTLRSRVPSNIHFDRRYIDPDKGVMITVTGVPGSRNLGYRVRSRPLLLVLKPGSFAASTARSALLIFLHLAVFTVLAVCASTFLSAPVAILVTLFVAISGVFRDFLMNRLAATGATEWPNSLAETVEKVGVEGAATEYLRAAFFKALGFLAPSFERFSSGLYITEGWAVPWSAVGSALAYVLPYTFLCIGLAYTLFRVREFE
jgi:hypothetical protein